MIHIPTGEMNIDVVDFELPGIIPIKWIRNYDSWVNHANGGGLGDLWTHNYAQYLEISSTGDYIIWQKSNGSSVAIPFIEKGEETIYKQEKISFQRIENQIILEDYGEGFFYTFTSDVYGGERYFRLTDISKYQFSIRLHYRSGQLYRITDTANRLIDLTRNHRNQISHISVIVESESPQILISYKYDGSGRLVGATNALSITEGYEYKGDLLVCKIDGNNQSFHWKYEEKETKARCLRRYFSDGTSLERFEYEAGKTKITNANGATTTHYIEGDNIVQVEDPMGNSEYWEYNLDDELTCYTDALGNNTYYGYDSYGHQVSIRLPNGGVTKYTYESNRLTMATNAMGAVVLWEYNSLGQLITRIGENHEITRYEYDNNLLSKVIDPNGQRTELLYTENHQLSKIIASNGVVTSWEYDSLGRILSSQNSEQQYQAYRYDSLGRLTSIGTMDANHIRLSYDGLGNVIRAKDGHHDVEFAYNAAGNLISRKENRTTVYFKYDQASYLNSIVNEHHDAYYFERDQSGSITKEIGFDGREQVYRRDANGQVTLLQDQEGRQTKYVYNAIGKINKVIHYTGKEETYHYNKGGLLTKAVNPHATVVLERDKLGAITKEIQNGITVASTYNSMGYRTHIASSLGASINIERNKDNSISQTQASTAESSWEASYKYDSLGLEIERTLPGQVTGRWHRREDGKPDVHSVSVGEHQTQHRRYEWQINDRLLSIHNKLTGKGVLFSHDVFGNLSQASYGEGQYDYKLPDEVGNLYKTEHKTDRVYGKAGQLLSCPDYNYSYDLRGNLIRKEGKECLSVWEYQWDESNMLTQVTNPDGLVVSFTYDALGRRLSKRINEESITYWVYDGNVPLHEWSLCDKEDLITWVFEEGTFIPQAKIQNNKSYSIITDHLGTPIASYDSDGKKVWECELDIYGKVRTIVGDKTFIPFRYQGQYEDVETGLYYNRFRYYSPDSGCYISQDPIGLAGGMPNMYSYVHDSNLLVDRLGLTGDLGSIQGTINSILESHLPQIQAIDPNATIGYRGSAASGISKAHDPNISRAIDPNNFDVDAFIQSDYLANDPVFTNRRRDASKIRGMADIEASIDKQLREAFPNNKFKGESFGFRVFNSWELDDMARKGDVQIRLNCH